MKDYVLAAVLAGPLEYRKRLQDGIDAINKKQVDLINEVGVGNLPLLVLVMRSVLPHLEREIGEKGMRIVTDLEETMTAAFFRVPTAEIRGGEDARQ